MEPLFKDIKISLSNYKHCNIQETEVNPAAASSARSVPNRESFSVRAQSRSDAPRQETVPGPGGRGQGQAFGGGGGTLS